MSKLSDTALRVKEIENLRLASVKTTLLLLPRAWGLQGRVRFAKKYMRRIYMSVDKTSTGIGTNMELKISWYWGLIGLLGFLGVLFNQQLFFLFFVFFIFFILPRKPQPTIA